MDVTIWRQLASKCSERLLAAPGISQLHSRLTGRRHVILTFHRIREAGRPIDPFDTCPSHSMSDFKRIVEGLARTYQFTRLVDLPNQWRGKRRLAAITFDDGWRDNFDLAFPYLERQGIPATLFVTTDKIGESRPFWQQILGSLFRQAVSTNALADRINLALNLSGKSRPTHLAYRVAVDQLKRTQDDPGAFLDQYFATEIDGKSRDRCFVDEHEIQQLSTSCFSIGSHTCSHRLLTRLSSDDIRRELVESKRRLEHVIGARVDTIAYPNGNADERVRTIAAGVGYTLGFTTVNRPFRAGEDPLLLPRVEPAWDHLAGCGA